MTNPGDSGQVSSYVQYLPAPLQSGRFVGRFLLAFEAILSGIDGGDRPAVPERLRGLGETLDEVARYFQPQETPADFLPWLAGWVAVELREDWSVETQRNVVASIVPLYMLRGTRLGIEQAVRLCVQETADVDVDDSDSATYPAYFQVTLTVDAKQTPATMRQLYRKVEAAIELQKPAHTYYYLQLRYPSLWLRDAPDPDLGYAPTVPQMMGATEGIYVARNTILGSVEADPETGNKHPSPPSSSNDQ